MARACRVEIYDTDTGETLESFIVEHGDDHVVDFGDETYTMQHPLRERPHLMDCQLHHRAGVERVLRKLPNGRYLVNVGPNSEIDFERII